MSLAIFKADFRRYWKLLLVFTVVLLFYFVVMMSMFNPTNAASVEEMMKLMPQGMLDAFGMGNLSSTFTGSLANYFYGMIVFLFPTICFIIIGNGIVAHYVDSGAVANFLATPLTRTRFVITQAVFLLFSLTLLFGILVGVGIASCEALYPGELDLKAFLLMNLASYLTYLCITGISFCASCLFNDTGKSLLFGAGLPILFMLMKMMGQANDKVSWMAEISPYSLYSPTEIAQSGQLELLPTVVLAAAALFTYLLGIAAFRKKNLPV